VRYSFHGKVRATGQTVDGFVEAPNSTAAIDRLADRGIIGVYSVRPAPKPPEEAEKPAAQLPAPPPQPSPAPVPAKSDSEVVFTTLVDKLGTLLSQVERLLEKPPQQVIYQTHNSTTMTPAREASQRVRRPSPNMASNSTLRDIFLTNLDLRQSLEKLASNGGTSKAMSDGAKTVAEAANRLTQAAVDATASKEPAANKELQQVQSEQVEEEADAEHHTPANGRETTAREAKGHGLVTAQPAA
jgi:hypothetical protein